jgi:hypothetical protein
MKFHLLQVFSFGLIAPISNSTAATFFEWAPLPYFSEEDSPFIDGIRNGSIYLEDFEDQALNTPFVTSPINLGYFGGTQRALAPNISDANVWSVDGDDGILDGNGFLGDSWITINSSGFSVSSRKQFNFSADAEGRYPTFVGLVITGAGDVDQNVEFAARNASGQLLDVEGDYDPKDWNPPGGAIGGDPRTHRFVGVYFEGGISEFSMDNVFQVDHLQYGYAIPEPSTALLVLGAFPFVFRRRR